MVGAIADWWSVTASFVVLGGFLLLMCIPIVRLTRRAAASAIANEVPEVT